MEESRSLKRAIRGTLILRRDGRLFKVIGTRHAGGNSWTFECKDLESRQRRVFEHDMPGMPKALDAATKAMKDPKDILLIGSDNQGQWKITTKEQIGKVQKVTGN